MFTKILFLCSAINVGDVGHTSQLTENLKIMAPNAQVVSIDANAPTDQIIQSYQQEASGKSHKPIVVCAVGEKGLQALVNLDKRGALDRQQTYVAASIHQNFKELNEISLDFLAIPEASVSETEKTALLTKTPAVSFMFAVPASNPTPDTIKKAYETWDHPQKPDLHHNTIIVMLPGDAPDSDGSIKYFTTASAQKLFDQLYAFWQARGGTHKIIIQNGPRTGKHDPETGHVVCTHEYQTGSDAAKAIDPVSAYFVSLCKEKNLDYSFFNFAFELDGQTKKSNSVFNQLLYVAQHPEQDNYFILPGESVSMLGQIPLYLPSDKIIVFKPDSMNEAHQNIFALGVQRGYFSYFTETGNIVTPTRSGKRTEDDGKQVVRDLIAGYYDQQR